MKSAVAPIIDTSPIYYIISGFLCVPVSMVIGIHQLWIPFGTLDNLSNKKVKFQAVSLILQKNLLVFCMENSSSVLESHEIFF